MVCFFTEQLLHPLTGLRALGIAAMRKKKRHATSAGRVLCRQQKAQLHYIHTVTYISKFYCIFIIFYYIFNLKLSKWSLKYSQLLLCRCGNPSCFKTWVQPFFLLFFFLVRHQIFNRSVYAKILQPKPQNIST